MDTRRFSAIVPILFLVVLSLIVLLPEINIYPAPWFDEGYVTHPANVLTQRGVYGTYSVSGYWPFDPLAATGPTMVLPVAVMFKLFGVGTTQARIVPTIYSLITVIGLYALGTRLYGRTAGFAAALLLIAIPWVPDVRLLLVGRQALGEPGAIALETLGLVLLYESWRRKSPWWSIGAGVAFGFGLVSKLQSGFALMPALLIITAARLWVYRKRFVATLTPVLITIIITVSWQLIQRLGMPENLRIESSQLQVDGATTHFITGLFGRTLTTTALSIAGAIGLGAILGIWRLWHAFMQAGKSFRNLTEAQWMEIFLVVSGLTFVVWFTLFSVGWPRYTYVAITWSGLLLAKTAWDVLMWLNQRIKLPQRAAYGGLAIALTGIGLWSNLQPLQDFHDTELDATAEYIKANIPQDAVIESWEWQLDALSGHWEFHHPDGETVYKAIHQYSHEGIPFNLEYDPLQADPDYLIVGPYAIWTRIYDTPAVYDNFETVAQVGEYTIMRRKAE